MDQMEMSTSNEVEMATTPAEHSNSEIELNLEQDPGLLQSVKRDFTNDALVKEEILEDTDQDSSKQQCVHASSTPAGTGHANEASSTSLIQSLNVKYESSEMDIGPIVLQHMDAHYTVNKIKHNLEQDPGLLQSVKRDFTNDVLVKEEILEDTDQDSLTPHNAIMKERSIREHQLASDCKVLVMTLNVFQCDTCHAVHTDKLRLLQHLQSMHACCPRTSLVEKVGKTNKRTTAAATMEHMEMSIKTEAEMAATSAVHSDSEQNPELLQSVKCEPTFTNDVFTKEDILEASTRDDSQLQLVDSALTLAGTSGVNEICNLSLCDLLNVKYESAEMDVGPTVLQHMDSHYTINKQNMSAATEVNTQADDHNEAMSGCRVKEDSAEDKWRGNISSCYRCTSCGKTFSKAHLLSAHRKLHERNSVTSGASSSAVTGPANVLHSQAMQAETKPGIGLSGCHICRCKFNMKRNLARHVRTHTGEKPFQCDTCSARFITNCELTTHKRVHTGEKPYKCDTCNARFTTSSYLTRHKRVHSGEKPFQCDTCNATFTTSSDLTKHKRVHSGDKPFECTECGLKFTQKCNANRHVRTLHSK